MGITLSLKEKQKSIEEEPFDIISNHRYDSKIYGESILEKMLKLHKNTFPFMDNNILTTSPSNPNNYYNKILKNKNPRIIIGVKND